MDKNNLDQSSIVLNTTQKSPTIIGIYPSDNFGIDQVKGLEAAFSNTALPISYNHMNQFSTKQLKSKDGSNKLMNKLNKLIQNENVLGIVGPSITECTDDVLKSLDEINSKIPVFILSAASDEFLGWSKKRENLNLYRIGSSISKRAEDFGRVLSKSSRIGKVVMIVEKNLKTPDIVSFGELFYHELKKNKELKSLLDDGTIKRIYYESDSEVCKESISSAFKEAISFGAEYVFSIGVGSEIKHIVEEFYKEKNPDLPKYGGWMHGYMLNDELLADSSLINGAKIFEITDINFNTSIKSSHTEYFETLFGKLHPGHRDIALTYDAATILISSLERMYKDSETPLSDKIKLDSSVYMYLANEYIESESFNLTIMNGKFVDGQNSSLQLQMGLFEPETMSWEHIIFEDFWK